MPTLTTKLEAVNSMLGTIGETPVNSISDTNALPVSASTAISALDELSRAIQSEGWCFNTEIDVTLTPSQDGTITLSADIIELDAIDTSIDIVQRGLSLFDRSNNTTVFDADIKVNQTRLLDWDSLPEPARRYITLSAARVFQARMISSRALESLITADEYKARALLQEFDAGSADRTMFDNYHTASILGINRPTTLI